MFGFLSYPKSRGTVSVECGQGSGGALLGRHTDAKVPGEGGTRLLVEGHDVEEGKQFAGAIAGRRRR